MAAQQQRRGFPLLFSAMGAAGNWHEQRGKRQPRPVEIDPRNGEGDAHWAWTTLFGGNDHVAAESEKVAKVLLRYAPALAKLSHFGGGLFRAEGNVEAV